MTDRRRRLPIVPAAAVLLGAALLLAACSTGGGAGSVTPASVDPSTPTPAGTTTPAHPSAPSEPGGTPPDASESPPDPTAASPVIDAAWATAELTDVATGEPFRIADLAGKTVIVETMAIWCPSCRAQQGDVQAALDQLDPERVAYVVLDVDPSESGPALAQYQTQNGFEGTYAIAGQEVARALRDEFGDQVLNPPSTPIILIGTDGRVTLTDYGHKSAETIVELARDHGA